MSNDEINQKNSNDENFEIVEQKINSFKQLRPDKAEILDNIKALIIEYAKDFKGFYHTSKFLYGGKFTTYFELPETIKFTSNDITLIVRELSRYKIFEVFDPFSIYCKAPSPTAKRVFVGIWFEKLFTKAIHDTSQALGLLYRTIGHQIVGFPVLSLAIGYIAHNLSPIKAIILISELKELIIQSHNWFEFFEHPKTLLEFLPVCNHYLSKIPKTFYKLKRNITIEKIEEFADELAPYVEPNDKQTIVNALFDLLEHIKTDQNYPKFKHGFFTQCRQIIINIAERVLADFEKDKTEFYTHAGKIFGDDADVSEAYKPSKLRKRPKQSRPREKKTTAMRGVR